MGEGLGGQKPQESKGSRPELILWGASERHCFSGGLKPLKHSEQGLAVLSPSAGMEPGLETILGSLGRKKALKRESQECWELEKASKGMTC
jgi:hypothetical protein